MNMNMTNKQTHVNAFFRDNRYVVIAIDANNNEHVFLCKTLNDVDAIESFDVDVFDINEMSINEKFDFAQIICESIIMYNNTNTTTH